MNRIDIARLVKDQQIHIGNMSIANSMGEIYNNYNWPRRVPPIHRHGYSQKRLQRLALDITIDTIEMYRRTMSYKIAAKKFGQTAVLLLAHSESRFYNITNNATAKKKNHFAIARMRTRLMDAGNLSLDYRFNLMAKNGAFSATVKLGEMDGRVLNPLAGALAMINVRSASVSKMLMEVKANETVAKGNIDLFYTDMKVDILKLDNKTDTLKKKKFLSFITNLALPNDNPKKSGKFRKGPIDVSRNPRTSFFGFTWQEMRDGMSSTITGFDQHKDKPNENIIIKVGRKIFKPQKIKNGKTLDF